MSVNYVFCPHCKGGNDPRTIQCQWCGRPLVTALPSVIVNAPQSQVGPCVLYGAIGAFIAMVLIVGVVCIGPVVFCSSLTAMGIPGLPTPIP